MMPVITGPPLLTDESWVRDVNSYWSTLKIEYKPKSKMTLVDGMKLQYRSLTLPSVEDLSLPYWVSES